MPVSNPIADLTIDYSLGTYSHVILGEPYGGINIDIINVPQDVTVPADLTVIFENQTRSLSFGPSWIPEVNLDDVANYAIGLGNTVIYKLYSTDGGISWYGTMLTPNSNRYVRITGDTMTGQLIQNLDGVVSEVIRYGTGPGDNAFGSNTLFGANSLSNNTTGDRNTVFGSNSMSVNTTGYANVVVGSSCLFSSDSGSENVVVGALAAANLKDNSRNVLVGRKAYQTVGTDRTFNVTYGDDNVVIGANAARLADYHRIYNPYSELTEGFFPRNNCIIGSGAAEQLYAVDASVIIGKGAASGSATTDIAYHVVAIGTDAMNITRSNTGAPRGGDGDVAVGYGSMSASRPQDLFNQLASTSIGTNTGGGNASVAVGAGAMLNTTSSHYNTVVGGRAGASLSGGQNNTLIGYQAGTDAVGNITTQNNYIVLGNNLTTNANIKVAWTVTSDARDKTDIVPLSHGLEFVNQLQPRQFKLKDRETQLATTGNRYGFIAQEVLELEGADPIIIDVSDVDNLKMKESLLVPVLTKAIQELSAKLDQALTRIATLESK